MEYTIKKTDVIAPSLYNRAWDKAQTGDIANEPWPGLTGFAPPNTRFWMLRDSEGISIRFETDEKNLRAEVTRENGEVCCDSCVEFFFKPDVYDVNYINFEINPKGVMHIGLGKDRYGRVHLTEDRSIFCVESDVKDGSWCIKYYIPDSFLLKYFKRICPVCRANFYKCGDKTDHPHYSVWNMVETENPDYHVADFFGVVRIEK